LVALFSGFIIFLVTFPGFVPDYGTGLDPSYVWAINYLFVHDYTALTNLIYPIGPLGFLKYTVAFEQNLFIGILAFSIFKFGFVYLLLRLSIQTKGQLKLLSFLVVLLVSSFSGIDFSIIGITVILLLFSIKTNKKYLFLFLANLAAFVGLCIKSSIGIAAYSSIFTYFVFTLFSKEISFKKSAVFATLSLVVFALGGVLVFQGLNVFFHFLIGLMHLAGGYASALSLFPENNWWLLGGFAITVLVFPFLVKKRDERIVFALLILPLFAMWKHAMGREDISHIYVLLNFLFVFWGILFLSAKRLNVWYVVLPLLSILFVSENMRAVKLHNGLNFNLKGVTNFNETVVHFSEFDSTYKAVSKENVALNRLDDSLKRLIGSKLVDVYPWDLSYVPANQLNWKPRKTLELGAANSQWLSQKNALCFGEETGPEFVILHLNNDKWGGSMGTLDGRYLLNDEPLVVFSFLKNYKVVQKTNRLLLLQKEISNLESYTFKEEATSWNTWVDVPQLAQITRVKFTSDRSFLLKIKSFLYKDEACFIDYRLENGRVLSYRFVASNAADGLWVNPLILNPETNRKEPAVKAIRFRSTNSNLMTSAIFLEWESINIDANYFFRKNDLIEERHVYRVIENYDSNKNTSSKLDKTIRFSEPYSEMVLPGTYASTTKILLDTIWPEGVTKLKVEANLMYYLERSEGTDAVLVLSVQDSQSDFWKTFTLSEEDNPGEWNFGFVGELLAKKDHQTGTLSIYVWNKGSTTVYIDDFSKTIGYE
jgi:hypothetical protein